MDEREFFDRLAPQWDANEVLSTPERVNYILDFMEIQPGNNVLDLGTGTGVLLPYIADRVGKDGAITAVDYSEGMLTRAREKYKHITPTPQFLNLDLEKETIEGEFDHIILYCVYPHLHQPDETLKWLRSVNLKSGGSIWVAFPCSETFINDIHRQRHSESDNLLSARCLAEWMNERGLNAEVVSANNESYVIRIRK